jgi:hypothetical protein
MGKRYATPSSTRSGYGKKAHTSGWESIAEPAGTGSQDERTEQHESQTIQKHVVLRKTL